MVQALEQTQRSYQAIEQENSKVFSPGEGCRRRGSALRSHARPVQPHLGGARGWIVTVLAPQPQRPGFESSMSLVGRSLLG